MNIRDLIPGIRVTDGTRTGTLVGTSSAYYKPSHKTVAEVRWDGEDYAAVDEFYGKDRGTPVTPAKLRAIATTQLTRHTDEHGDRFYRTDDGFRIVRVDGGKPWLIIRPDGRTRGARTLAAAQQVIQNIRQEG